MNPASRPTLMSTVSALPDLVLLAQTRTLARHEQVLQILVLDHLREIESRRLYLRRGFSSLFDYAVRELEYSDGAAWRRIKAMRLCSETLLAREQLEDGSLSLSAAAQLQNTFERWDRDANRGQRPGTESATPVELPGAAAVAPAAAQQPGLPVDAAAREKLVEQAAGKSTREVKQMLAAVDPESALPDDRVRALGGGRWELKVVIDAECERGLEKLKGLLSHVDPHQTMGQIVGRLVQDGLDRYDPARPRRTRRKAGRASSEAARPGSHGTPASPERGVPVSADGTSPAKAAPHEPMAAAPAGRSVQCAESAASRAEGMAIPGNGSPTVATPNARATGSGPSPAKDSPRQKDDATPRTGRRAQPAIIPAELAGRRSSGSSPSSPATSSRARYPDNDTSPAKSSEDRDPGDSPPSGGRMRPTNGSADIVSHGDCVEMAAKAFRPPDSGRTSPAKWAVAGSSPPAATAQATGSDTSCPKDREARAAAMPRRRTRRPIPVRVKREVWQRDEGKCSFVDPHSGRRCGSRFLLEIDHVVPYAVGGTHDAGNLRVYCGAHHRYRHSARGETQPDLATWESTVFDGRQKDCGGDKYDEDGRTDRFSPTNAELVRR